MPLTRANTSNSSPRLIDLNDKPHRTKIEGWRRAAAIPGVIVHAETVADSHQTMVFGSIDNASNPHSASDPPRKATANESLALFPIASYSKIFINYVWALLAKEPKFSPIELSMGTRVNDILRKIGQLSGRRSFSPLSEDPFLAELLCHDSAFVGMNEHILAPDDRCILSNEEFLEIASRLTRNELKRRRTEQQAGKLPEVHSNPDGSDRHEYSNANHIFAAIMLEELLQIPFDAIMDRYVFKPFDMKHTFMGRDLRPGEEDLLAPGYQLNSKLLKREVKPPRYGDSVGKYILGAFSCIADLVLFNRALASALKDGDGTVLNLFTPKSEVERSSLHYYNSMAGEVFKLDSRIAVPRSINNLLQPPDSLAARPYFLSNKDFFEVYRAIGYVNGYSTAVYYHREHTHRFVIVLGTSSGPLDIADHIVHYTLQESFGLKPRMDDDFHSYLERAQHKMKEVEEQPKIYTTEKDLFNDIAGSYMHEIYSQRLKIEPDGKISICGSRFSSSLFQLKRCGRALFRITPGTSEFGIETWTSWKHLTLSMVIVEDRVCLVHPKMGRYRRD